MEGFRKLFFSAVFCGAFVAPVWGASSLPDLSNKLSGTMDAYNKLPPEVKNDIENFDDTTEQPQESSNNTGSQQPDSNENSDTDSTDEVVVVEVDDDYYEIMNTIADLGWCPTDGSEPSEPRKAELCKSLSEVESLDDELSANTQALEENYQNMKDKETSFENRMLGAAGIGTVGIGGMMAASALAEQSADAAAERDMQAYLSTFQCKIGDKGGKSYPGGTMGIELGGANQLINLYQEYAKLADDLKERKSALGLKSGIESEVLIDKASSGLYDDVGHGIGSGAYASIARALQNPDGADAQKWNEMKEKTSKNLKTGAGVAIGGAIATAAANYAINHDNKNKSDELLAQRDKIKENLKSRYKEIAQQFVDECNAIIQAHKSRVSETPNQQFTIVKQYIKDVNDAKPIKTLQEIKDSKFCR